MTQYLEIAPTRLNRLLGTLALVGMVHQMPDRKVRPGAGVHVLAAQRLAGSRFPSVALTSLERLRGEKRTVALDVRWRRSSCFLYYARPGLSVNKLTEHIA